MKFTVQCSLHIYVLNPCSYTSGEGNGTPLRYSCLENPMDGGAWWAAVHGVARSQTRLNDFTFTFHFHALEKEMATHSSVLAWRIPGTAGEPGGLPSMGSHRVEHDWSNLTAVAATAVIPEKHLLSFPLYRLRNWDREVKQFIQVYEPIKQRSQDFNILVFFLFLLIDKYISWRK